MERVFERAGEFGRFQMGVLCLVGLVSALSSATIFATIFAVAEPNLVCLSSNRSTITETDTCTLWSQLRKNATDTNLTHTCQFETKHYTSTIVSEWELVCERNYMAGLTQTVQILGSIFGFFGGIFGDRFGRYKATILFSSMLTLTLLGSQLALLPMFNIGFEAKYIIYTVSQFLIGLLVNCYFNTAYVLLMEFTTEKYKTKMANVISYMYVFGELLVLIVYYFSRNWHILHWFIGAFSFLLLTATCVLLPESPLWLISVNRHAEAGEILKKIAKTNGRKEFDFEMSELKDTDESEKLIEAETENNETEKVDDAPKKTSLWFKVKAGLMLTEIFLPRKVFLKTMIMLYVWFAVLLLYYGISLGVIEDSEIVDPYLMFLLSAVAEFAGYVFCYLNDIFGRKKTLCGFMLATTLMYALLALMNHTANVTARVDGISVKLVLLIIMALVGKCAVSGAYNISYIYTAELYPTSTRNTALILLTCFGSSSSLLAPHIDKLKTHVWYPLPYFVYSGSALLAAFLLAFLPETFKNRKS
jgi:MFS family permease